MPGAINSLCFAGGNRYLIARVDDVDYSFDLARLDWNLLATWLGSTYWSAGIPQERIERGFKGSTAVIGAYCHGRQVGVARALSDTTRFAFIADVFVDPGFRRRGIGRTMVRRLLEHPSVVDADSCYLRTLDAHDVYRALGFEQLDDGKLMRRKRIA